MDMLCSERVMEDLLGRFQLGRASYELKAEEAEAIRANFTTAPAAVSNGSVAYPSQVLTSARSATEYVAWKEQHPSILDEFQEFAKLVRGKRLAVFLDYDGTLTPIVKDPDRAYMAEQMRAAVRTVAGLFPTSIISGRGREKVEGFVQLKELYYAGSHGMDIVGPKANTNPGDADVLAFQPAAKYAPIMDAVYKALLTRVRSIPGATVEHNKFCVSVHFRNCPPEAYDDVLTAVKDTLHDHPGLKASRGRKVLEIQPQVDWGKGKALAHMLKALSLDDCDDVIPIYLGDDRTDEDAFKVLKDRAAGFGILISNKMKETEAKYTLTDPSEVMTFLLRLVQWGATPDNAWHQHLCCTGWCLNPNPQPPSHSTPDPSGRADSPLKATHTRTDRQTDAMPEPLSDGIQQNGTLVTDIDTDTLQGAHRHGAGATHTGTDAAEGNAESANATAQIHSPNSGSAFAAVRHFHGLPVAAGTSDRAMPASQWATEASPSRREAASHMGTHHANVSVTDLVDMSLQPPHTNASTADPVILSHQQPLNTQQPAEGQTLPNGGGPAAEDAPDRQSAALPRQDDSEEQGSRESSSGKDEEKPVAEECNGRIEAEGRPPTSPKAAEAVLSQTEATQAEAATAAVQGPEDSMAESSGEVEGEEDLAPPSRSSLDHYLRQPLKASQTADDNGMSDDPDVADKMGQWDAPALQLNASSGLKSKSKAHSPSRSTVPKQFMGRSSHDLRQGHEDAKFGRMLPDGKRLTALLLDKLQGHEGHVPLGQDTSEGGPVSPGGQTHSHDSGSSLAGYQSPFESLAYEVRSEGTDSVKAEDGSVKSLGLANSGQLDAHASGW